jgi:hypothetical protein
VAIERGSNQSGRAVPKVYFALLKEELIIWKESTEGETFVIGYRL